MSDDLKKGDAVTWNSPQGRIDGTIVEKLTTPTDIEGHHVAASMDNPQYRVRSDRTGAEAAHKAEALTKRA